MPNRELTPEQHRALSFLHSQGSPNAQLHLVDYIEMDSGLVPETHIDHDTIKHFVRYLVQSADNGNHMDVRLNHQAAESTLARFKFDVEHRVPVRYRDKQAVVADLALSLVYQETKLLNPARPDTTEINGISQQNRRQRMAKRVQEGRASLLAYYGQEQHATHYEPYDHMYSEVTEYLEDPDTSTHNPRAKMLIDRHRKLVDDAEKNFPSL